MELYTHARPENPSDPNSYCQPNFCPSAESAYIHRMRFRTGFHSRRRTRGGLVRSTARTSRSLLCKSGAVFEMATAATRPLSLVWCCLRHHSTHALLCATTLTHPTMTLSLGHAVACSRIPTAISLSYRDLTHAVSLTHGVSHTHTPFHSRSVFLSHTLFLPHTLFPSHIVLLPYTTFH